MGFLNVHIVPPKYLGKNQPVNLFQVFMMEDIFALDS